MRQKREDVRHSTPSDPAMDIDLQRPVLQRCHRVKPLMGHADSEKPQFQDNRGAEVASAAFVVVDCTLDRLATACEDSGNAQISTWFQGSRGVPALFCAVEAASRRPLSGGF